MIDVDSSVAPNDAPVLSCVGVVKHFGGTRALRGIDFSVNAGDAFGIVGESGSGKSLTLRAIMALLPTSARLDSGLVVVEGEKLATAGHAARVQRRARVAMVFQDPLSALNPVRTIGDQVAEVPRRVLKRSRSESAKPTREDLLVRILELVKKKPGIRPSEINRALNLEQSDDLRQALIDRGLVRKTKEGREVHLYPR